MTKQELFEVGDNVTWASKYEPNNPMMKQCGRGPFVVFAVAPAEGPCLHSRSHSSGRCPKPGKPLHPQAVSINNSRGKFVGQMSGAHLKKV